MWGIKADGRIMQSCYNACETRSVLDKEVVLGVHEHVHEVLTFVQVGQVGYQIEEHQKLCSFKALGKLILAVSDVKFFHSCFCYFCYFGYICLRRIGRSMLRLNLAWFQSSCSFKVTL